jgi:soluble lytic murein transglycosylase-like protein
VASAGSKTVIDELIVTLGLDPKNFKKGEKEAAASLVDLKKKAKETGEEVSKAGDEAGNSWVAAGKRFLAVAAIWKVLSYTTRNILEASRATYDLANASRHLDTSARHLKNFENVAEMMGGTAEGARNTIAGLHKAISDAKFNGVVSQQLVQLGRLGVQFTGVGGRMRDFKEIYLDTADAISRQVEMGNMTQGEALDFLTNNAGFDAGLARAAVGGRDSAAAALARQEARRQINDGDITAATANEQAIISASHAKNAAFTNAQTNASGFITRVAAAKEAAFNAGETGEISQAWETLKEVLAPVSGGLVNLAEGAEAATKSMWGAARAWALGKGRSGYEGAIQSSAKRHGLDPEILAGLLHTESRFDPNAVSPAGAVGIAQLMPEYFPGAGINPVDDIETAAAHLARLKANFMRSGSDEADAMDKALMAYNGGERRVRTSSMFGDGSNPKPLTGETLAYPGHVYEYAAAAGTRGGGGSTSIQIDDVNVYTQATDAEGMAAAADGALKRKLGAAQAEQGMQ